MSSLRVLQKPTLGLLLSNPQTEEQLQNSQEKITFPKINTKLKKTQFTKYRSAFINAKNCDPYLQPQLNEKLYEHSLHNNTKPKERQNYHTNDKKIKSQLNKNVWKLNQKHNKSYTINSPEKLHQSRNKSQSVTDENIQRKDKIMNQSDLNNFQTNKIEKFTLLTEIRQLNMSPIKYAETCRDDKPIHRKSEDINESIQRSNKIISLIEKNYKKGFFNHSSQQESNYDKLQQKLGLFAYLRRNFVTKKQTLTPEKVREYFKSPSNKKLEAKINFETRSFLKQKLHNDYRSYNEVNKLRQDLSEKAIKQQILQKRVAFQQEYNKKYNVPYMSFLSLPKNLKAKVLENLTQPTKKIVNK